MSWRPNNDQRGFILFLAAIAIFIYLMSHFAGP